MRIIQPVSNDLA